MADSMEDRMIEAEEREGIDPDQAYEHVRESMADAADRKRVLAPPMCRLWVNEERTMLVRLWNTGTVEVATRKDPVYTWSPPTYLTEEKV